MKPEVMSVFISFGSLIVACVSAYISWGNAQRQAELSHEQGVLTEKLNRQDQDFERKRFITALWDKMASIVEIRPDEQGHYNDADVLDALDTLELVSICWDHKIVDQWMVFLVFGKGFLLRVKEIEDINRPLEALRRTGPELLQDRLIISEVARQIEKMSRDQLQRKP
jgi:hypothetical protein